MTIGLGTKHDILGQWSHSSTQSASENVSPESSSTTSKTNLRKSFLVGEHSPLLELNCHIKANPWIEEVIWHVDGGPIVAVAGSSHEPFYSSAISASTFNAQFEAHPKRTSSSSSQQHSSSLANIYLTNHNQTLRLENVARVHAGLYQCVARNAINVTFSEAVQLNVACKCDAFFTEYKVKPSAITTDQSISH